MWCKPCTRRKQQRRHATNPVLEHIEHTPQVISVGALVERGAKLTWLPNQEPTFEFVRHDYLELWGKFYLHLINLRRLSSFWGSLGNYLKEIRHRGEDIPSETLCYSESYGGAADASSKGEKEPGGEDEADILRRSAKHKLSGKGRATKAKPYKRRGTVDTECP